MTLLVLGGTTEARELVLQLAAAQPEERVIYSLAGRVRHPAAVPAQTRIGPFGGVDGLVRFLRDEQVTAMIDATHPFAVQMPQHAAAAACTTGIPHLRLLRPPWTPGSADHWVSAADEDQAAAQVEKLGLSRPFLALGRQHLAPFLRLDVEALIVRSIDPLPLDDQRVVNLLGRGPFSEPEERACLLQERADGLVARNSGGASSAAKLVSAAALSLPVILIDRPAPAPEPITNDVDGALAWLKALRPASGGQPAPDAG